MIRHDLSPLQEHNNMVPNRHLFHLESIVYFYLFHNLSSYIFEKDKITTVIVDFKQF